jgi:hypothetical protein
MGLGASIGEIRKRIAHRAEALTGVDSEEILRTLGFAHIEGHPWAGECNWRIDILATSEWVRLAIQHAISDTINEMPIAASSRQR